MHAPETPEMAARRALSRWRYLAIGLALVGFTNLVNIGLNMAGLSGTHEPQGVCLRVAGITVLAEKAVDETVDRQPLDKRAPRR